MGWSEAVSSTIDKHRVKLDNQRPAGVELASLIAVLTVEALGAGLGYISRPIIRFEVHKMWDLYGKNNVEVFSRHFKFDQHKRWLNHYYRTASNGRWYGLHKTSGDEGQMHEWNALYVAMQLGNDSMNAAIQSASWGVAQIMGFHYARLGYENPRSFMVAMFEEDKQIKAFIDFINTDPELLKALMDKDWRAFARIYNGSGQVDRYSQWISTCYDLAVNKLGD